MTLAPKLLAATLLGLMVLPAFAAGNQANGSEFNCSWLKTLQVTNKTLLGHMNKVMAKNFSCFSSRDMKGISVEDMDVVFDLSKNEATVMLENGKKIITLPLTGQEAVAPIAAKRSLIMLGGGGEPKNSNSSTFDPTLNALDSYLRGNEWSAVISFNGSNAQTEYIVEKGFPTAINKSRFTKTNYNLIIRNFESQLKSGDQKAGDQLLFMIASQGAMKTGSDLSHKIAVGAAAEDTNRNDLFDADTVSLDAFKDLVALAKEKKVKLAIIDFGSHSGNSLALADESACVISSSGPKHFSSTAFAENFIQAMKAGKSLEEVFLESRKNTGDASFPMISSPEGLSINRDLYPAITPYLYHYDSNPRRDKLASYLIEASSDAGLAARENEYREVQKKLDALQATRGGNNSSPDTNPIKILLTEYKDRQDRYISFERSLDVHELNRREKFEDSAEIGSKTHRMQGEYSWKQIIELDSDAIIRNVTNAKYSTNDAATQTQFQASINMHVKIRARKNEILEMHPKLKDYEQKLKVQLNDMGGSSLARKIAGEEKQIYDHMYRNLRSKQPRSNPCKDFVL